MALGRCRTAAHRARVGSETHTSAPLGWCIDGVGAAAVGLGDRLTIASPRPAPPRPAGGVGSGEPLEGPVEEVVREAAAVVADVKLDGFAVHGGRFEPDLVAAVAKRVVDEVAERLLQPMPVAAHRRALRRPRARRAFRPPRRAIRRGWRRTRGARRVDGLEPERQATAIGARDQQQVLGELREAIHLLATSVGPPPSTPSAESACRSASSSSVRSSASGVRSSWPASATKSRSRSSAASSRSSISFSVSPSRSSSSPVGGTGSRSPGVSAEMLGAAPAHRLDRPQRQPASR